MIDLPISRPVPRLHPPRLHLPHLHLPHLHLPSVKLRLRTPRRAVIVACTCGPLFAAQLLLLMLMLTQ